MKVMIVFSEKKVMIAFKWFSKLLLFDNEIQPNNRINS